MLGSSWSVKTEDEYNIVEGEKVKHIMLKFYHQETDIFQLTDIEELRLSYTKQRLLSSSANEESMWEDVTRTFCFNSESLLHVSQLREKRVSAARVPAIPKIFYSLQCS